MPNYRMGFLTVFDGLTISNYTTLKPTIIAVDTSKPALRMYMLPNGTKVNWNGIGDDDITPGQITQEIHCTSGGMSLFNNLKAKEGNYGVLTLTRMNSNPVTIVTMTCNANLVSVVDISPNPIHDTATMDLRMIFELWSVWS